MISHATSPATARYSAETSGQGFYFATPALSEPVFSIVERVEGTDDGGQITEYV
ncbi:MAG: hypothetical protein MUP16_03895 [Sedimentisphaerales bacterium]|nr:hypothetical protein [Sedimentisphaerales bacterium]